MREEAEKVVEELRKKEQEDKDRENLDQDTAQDNPMHHPAPSSDMITRGNVLLAELVLVPFTPSKHHAVACLGTIFFDKSMKTIVRRSEKMLKIGTQPNTITVTEKTIVEKTNQDPKFLASISVVTAQVNADNVEKLMEDAYHYKEKMIKMEDTLIKEIGEGQELKRKHEATL